MSMTVLSHAMCDQVWEQTYLVGVHSERETALSFPFVFFAPKKYLGAEIIEHI